MTNNHSYIGRKLVYPEGTHIDTERTCTLHTERPFLLAKTMHSDTELNDIEVNISPVELKPNKFTSELPKGPIVMAAIVVDEQG